MVTAFFSQAVLASALASTPAFLEKSLVPTERMGELRELVESKVPKKNVSAEERAGVVDRLTAYLAFMGMDAEAPGATEAEKKKDREYVDGVISSLLASSTQFLECDPTDWACIERKPKLTPTADFRLDTEEGLGDPVELATEPKIETFFTDRWDDFDQESSKVKPKMAQALADRIRADATDGLYMALYGIDDIGRSMKPVYDAIVAKAKDPRVEVQGVFDVDESALRSYDAVVSEGSVEIVRSGPLVFSYAEPSDKSRLDRWIFARPDWMNELIAEGIRATSGVEKAGEKAEILAKYELKSALKNITKERTDARWFLRSGVEGDARWQRLASSAVRVKYFYDGTADLMTILNAGAKKDADARGRMEWPREKIMHNKFLVMRKSAKEASVWSGTTNVARTCMGDENNANMAIYVKSTEIAEAFEKEFREMFELGCVAKPQAAAPLVDAKGSSKVMTGCFHTQKRPNTPRYFVHGDTEVRVHFSPTDDGEHRAILPMLLSAREGDVIRISMFGGNGVEAVRAMQYAAAQGAKVQIVADSTTGSQPSSWGVPRVAMAPVVDEDGNPVLDDDGKPKVSGQSRLDARINAGNKKDMTPAQNPYVPKGTVSKGSIELRWEKWNGVGPEPGGGLNHHKTASLSRKKIVGGKTLYVDEILIIGSQNWSNAGNNENDENMMTIRNPKGVAAASAFAKEFDENLWPTAAKRKLK